jgi:hypothetical protein
MSIQEEIKNGLDEYSAVYQEIASRLAELRVLQQADRAHAEYTQNTNRLDEEIRRLNARKKELEIPRERDRLASGTRSFQIQPKIQPTLGLSDPAPAKNVARPQIKSDRTTQEARTELKMLVGRWGKAWKLTIDVQGQINRIADDLDRPLGEALALLEWTTFENRIGTTETEEAHLERLSNWGTALVEYHERLRGEIDMLKTRYRFVMPILEAWSTRDTETGRKSWEQQISATNIAKEKEVERLQLEIAQLTAQP